MEERTQRIRRKADYTDRPLTEEEKAFAENAENYNQLFKFMRFNQLDPEEWYDILIIPYLQAVKKYCSRPELHIYPFHAISNKVLSCAVHHHYRAMHTKKRMPEGGFVSLDYTMEGDNPFSEYNLDAWLIDGRVNVERQVINKECFEEFWKAIDGFFWNEQMKVVASLLLDGYTKRETIEYVRIRFNDPQWGNNVHDWNFTINQLRTAFKETYGF